MEELRQWAKRVYFVWCDCVHVWLVSLQILERLSKNNVSHFTQHIYRLKDTSSFDGIFPSAFRIIYNSYAAWTGFTFTMVFFFLLFILFISLSFSHLPYTDIAKMKCFYFKIHHQLNDKKKTLTHKHIHKWYFDSFNFKTRMWELNEHWIMANVFSWTYVCFQSVEGKTRLHLLNSRYVNSLTSP